MSPEDCYSWLKNNCLLGAFHFYYKVLLDDLEMDKEKYHNQMIEFIAKARKLNEG